jgi:adenosylcobinamide-GDP ribazoletransferase
MTENQTSSNHTPEYQGGWWQDFLVALVFLTRLPLNPSFFFQMNALRSACRCFPLIGLIVGGAAGTIYIVSDITGLPSLVSAILAIGAQILLTGALHEDAVGDVADGFGGGQDKAKKLEIMRDSRVGTYAVVTLIIVLGLKVVAISHLPHPFLVFGILVSAAATSRGMITGALYFLPPARDDGLGHGSGRPELMSLLWAIIFSILISVLVLGPHLGSLALFFAILGASFMGIVAKRQIGGQTGDVLGAVQQVSEICFILACVAFSA